MNRYKVLKSTYPIVKKYLKNAKSVKTTELPTYARKFKKQLSFKGNILYINDKQVIPVEDVDTFLRNEFYDSKSTVPLSRDGGYHALKQRIAGITRARLMTFLKSQPASVSTQDDIAKPRRSGQVKRKAYHIETDLVFIRKPDLVKISDEFDRTVAKKETYIVSTVEAVTGLTRLDYILNKSKAMPVVLKHIKSISKQLGVPLNQFTGASDKGEVKMDVIKQYIPKWKFVSMGPRVEQNNSVIQKHVFRIARQGRGYDVKDLIKQAEAIQNNNFNRVLKRTPNESADIVKKDSKSVLAAFNKTRKSEITSVKTQFAVGDLVRLQIIKKKGIGFKSYKNETFSKAIYKITAKTKTSVPPKYRVNGKWITANTMLKTESPDQTSIELVSKREESRRTKRREHIAQRKAELAAEEEKAAKTPVKKKIKRKLEPDEDVVPPPAPIRRRSRRTAALKARRRQLEAIEKNAAIDKMLR